MTLPVLNATVLTERSGDPVSTNTASMVGRGLS